MVGLKRKVRCYAMIPQELLNKTHCIDNREGMMLLPNDCIDLVVTSPPYNCGKNYGVVKDSLPWDIYWDNTKNWLVESFRIIKPGGRLAVNIPWWMEKKPRKLVPFYFQEIAVEIGFHMLDKIIWVKGNSYNIHTSGGFGGGGCGWGTYMSPSGPSIRCASEPIMIFSKGSRGRGITSGEGRGACVKNDITKDEFMEWTLDVWFIRGEHNKKHPAVFPAEIPHRLIKLYTYQKEIVLDPFMGSGTTAKAAKKLGRDYIGFEINPEYLEIEKQRTAQECLCI